MTPTKTVFPSPADARSLHGERDAQSLTRSRDPAPRAPGVAMPFRVAGAQHRAVVGDVTYGCVREVIATDAGHSIRWSAYRNDELLKRECRTLNEAKNVCRAAEDARHSVSPGGEAASSSPAALPHPWQPAGRPADACERDG